MNDLASTLIARAAREQKPVQGELGLFEHLLYHQPAMMRPDQVSAVTGWSRRTVYDLCETGEKPGDAPFLEVHELPGRERKDKQITRRSVAAFLLRTARYEPKDFTSLLKLTLPTMTEGMLGEMRGFIEAELKRRAEQARGGRGETFFPKPKTQTHPNEDHEERAKSQVPSAK
jgi:heme-degrading monooxygenase HmoA